MIPQRLLSEYIRRRDSLCGDGYIIITQWRDGDSWFCRLRHPRKVRYINLYCSARHLTQTVNGRQVFIYSV